MNGMVDRTCNSCGYTVSYGQTCLCGKLEMREEPQERHYETHQRAVKSDGGPSGYYDFPAGVTTLNDLLEWLADCRWGKYALHMKDLMKGGFRFGAKDGTTLEYDCYKLIYSGCRLLVMVSGKSKVRDYLQKLLDDPQFK